MIACHAFELGDDKMENDRTSASLGYSLAILKMLKSAGLLTDKEYDRIEKIVEEHYEI